MKQFILAIAAFATASTGMPALAADGTIERAIASSARSDASRALDARRQPAEVLEFAAYEPGDVVADFGAGGGYFTELIARIVGATGRVYALNPAAFHNADAWQPLLDRHRNVSVMASDPRALQLAPASVDSIFMHLTFHDLYWESEQFNFPRLDVDYMLANWFSAVKPGGTVIVVDHVGPAGGDPREATAALHRIDPDTALAAMRRAGFELVEQADFLRNPADDHNVLVFDEKVAGKTDRFVMKFRRPA